MTNSRQGQGLNETAASEATERQLVYCQSAEVARWLERENVPWTVAPLSNSFSSDTSALIVVVGSNAAIFSSQVRAAIESDQARLIYASDVSPTLPAEASGVPISSFLIGPLRGETLRNCIASAFEDLALRRRQAPPLCRNRALPGRHCERRRSIHWYRFRPPQSSRPEPGGRRSAPGLPNSPTRPQGRCR